MEEGRPSQTAQMAALLRAAHLLVDGEPKILVDELAGKFLGIDSEEALRHSLQAMETAAAARSSPDWAPKLVRYTRATSVLRSRYVEDELSKALGRGMDQFVILGAGLDSFAYRRPDLVDVVQIFEVDHPATQAWKRVRLNALGVALPPNLSFVPLNFETQALVKGLQAGGYDVERPGFISWLGVTVYLTQEAIFGTLRQVAALAPDTEIIFGYIVPETLLEDEERQIRAGVRAATAAVGEPQLSFFEPQRLVAQVKALGFSEVRDFPPEEAQRRYFTGRTDGLRYPHWGHHIHAWV